MSFDPPVGSKKLTYDQWIFLVDGNAVMEIRELDYCDKNDVKKYFEAGYTPQRAFFACEAGEVIK